MFQTQKKKSACSQSLIAAASSGVSVVIVPTKIFTNKTVRRIMFPRQKYENFGSLAPLARNDLCFFREFLVFWSV